MNLYIYVWVWIREINYRVPECETRGNSGTFNRLLSFNRIVVGVAIYTCLYMKQFDLANYGRAFLYLDWYNLEFSFLVFELCSFICCLINCVFFRI